MENERKAIQNSVSVLDKLNQQNSIALDKKKLYKYIHKVVNYIEIVGWDSSYVVLKVHFQNTTPFYKNNEYICIYTTTTKSIHALVVYSYDIRLEQAARQVLLRTGKIVNDAADATIRNQILDNLSSTEELFWDKSIGKFRVEGFSFSPIEMKDYYEYPTPVINPISPRLGASLVGAPVHIKRLEVERLQCYSEDKRENG